MACTDLNRSYLASSGNEAAEKAAQKAGATREDLVSAAQDAYASASKTGGTSFASVTSYLSQQTDAAKDTAFDSWSESDLKSYLDSYGVKVPQGSTKNELIAFARRQRTWFQYGTTVSKHFLLLLRNTDFKYRPLQERFGPSYKALVTGS